MIRAVFWDNDGVLVDTEKLYFQATRELLLRAGVTLTPELFKRISLGEGRSAFDLAEERGAPGRRSIAFRRRGTGATRNCSRAASASSKASRRPSVCSGEGAPGDRDELPEGSFRCDAS